MRSQEDRDEQTLRIAAAVLGATAIWAVLAVALAIGVALVGDLDSRFQSLAPYAAVGYGITVVAWLRASHRRAS